MLTSQKFHYRTAYLIFLIFVKDREKLYETAIETKFLMKQLHFLFNDILHKILNIKHNVIFKI